MSTQNCNNQGSAVRNAFIALLGALIIQGCSSTDENAPSGGAGAGAAGEGGTSSSGQGGTSASGQAGTGAAGGLEQGGGGQGGQPLFAPCGASNSCDLILQGDTSGSDPMVVYVHFEAGKALVAPAFGLPANFVIKQTAYTQVVSMPQPGSNPVINIVHGPIELSPEQGSSSPLDLLALSLTESGTVDGPSMVVRQGKAICLGQEKPEIYSTTTSLDTTGAILALFDEKSPLASHETRRVAPWQSITVQASKPITSSLASISEATDDTNQAVSLGWEVDSQQQPIYQARVTFSSWIELLGKTVTLKVKAETPGGVASMSETSLPMFSFGPARPSLSFGAGLPADLEVWGTVPPSSEQCNTQGCLRLDTDSGFTVRLVQPGMTGLKIRYKLPVGQSLASPDSLRMAILLAPSGGNEQTIELNVAEAMKDRNISFMAPTAEVFLVVSGPTGAFNTQTDPTCAQKASPTAFIESIEPTTTSGSTN